MKTEWVPFKLLEKNVDIQASFLIKQANLKASRKKLRRHFPHLVMK